MNAKAPHGSTLPEIAPELSRGSRVDLDLVELDVASAAKVASAPVLHDIYLVDSFAPRLTKRGVRCQEVPLSSSEQARRANLLATYVREHRLRLRALTRHRSRCAS